MTERNEHTSPEVAAIAAKYLPRLDDEVHRLEHSIKLLTNLKGIIVELQSVLGSALTQARDKPDEG